jgi:6-phosphofructo-2-kinase/fructose-2,6-biphosphatase 2
MVGLPARGKTYISRRLCRYLNWVGVECTVFNVGNYRRQSYGVKYSHSFFDSSNQEANEQRKIAALSALIDMNQWFNSSNTNNSTCRVAIYDATNSTKERRNMIKTFCDSNGIKVSLLNLYFISLLSVMLDFIY